jgi:hypothetical protein
MAEPSSGRFAWIPVLIAAAFASASVLFALAPESCAKASHAEQPLAVEIDRVPLDPSAPARDRVGSLVYRGGLWLRSSDRRFGGLSDLRVSADGSRLWAVSDCGYGFSAALAYDSMGRLSGLGAPRIVELVGPDGERLSRDERDAESLVQDDSSLEVGFEGANRILAYALAPAFGGPARPLPTPSGLRGCKANGGIETMALLDGGRRLVVCEARRGRSLDTPAWIGKDDRWTERSYPLFFDGGWGGEPFRPTSAAGLPGGDVLVLERRFPPVGARVLRISSDDLRDATAVGSPRPLHPREIARFERPLTLDNFEGIDVRWDGRRALVYVLSDDNNCAKTRHGPRGSGWQRTLLLMFALDE